MEAQEVVWIAGALLTLAVLVIVGRALGNSMAVPVMRWIGERIQAVEAL